ncbi:O-antigen translocase [Amylibacter sp.]|nr:O-antigen translocase [Amylibacter sp.]
MSELSSSRGLIKSMLVIGSAQVVNILISIVRMKVLAVLLGPSGIGLLSIYNSLLGMVQQTAGLGMGSSGVREIASSRGEEATLSRVRHVLFAAHLIQGTLAMIAVWLLRERIAIWLFGEAVRATEVGLIGIAILIGLLTSAQRALLQGLRKIGDLGRVTVIGAFVGTLAGLAAVWLQGQSGLIWFILVQPLASVLIALHYTRRLPKPIAAGLSLVELWEVWKPMAKLGAAFMLGGLATAATLLLVRGLISKELGLDATGYFAAAWGITMIYVGFLLGAMGADYYPRLTEVIHDKVAAVRLMNDQAQLGLAIGGPVLLLLIGMAPWVITLLYSSAFEPAVTLLQWQMVGNVFKLASWAMSFSIVAAARGKTFFLMELSFNIVFLSMVFMFLPQVGLDVTAYAFVLAYLVYLTIVYVLARSIHGFRWQALSLGLLGLHASLGVALLVLALIAPFAAAVASPLLAAATGLFGLRIVLSKVGKHGRLPTRLYGIFERLGWTIQSAV